MHNNGCQGILKLLSLVMPIGNMNDQTYNDLMFMFDEKLMGYSVSLVMEIDELLDKKYTKEEIIEIINDCDFQKNDPELTCEEALYLRKEALRLLDIRYKIYMGDKYKEKTKKRLY